MAHYTGTAAQGEKARTLANERAKQLEAFHAQQEDIRRANAVKLNSMDAQFSAKTQGTDEQFKASTVGLVSATEFKRRRVELEAAAAEAAEAEARAHDKAKERKAKERKARLKSLSFDPDDEADAEAPAPVAVAAKRKAPDVDASSPAKAAGSDAAAAASPSNVAAASASGAAAPAGVATGSATVVPDAKRLKASGKDPTADTSFLPDRAREAAEAAERARLASEWRARQERVKQEQVEVVFSYWDGSGHRKHTVVQKGATIGQFLEKARKEIVDEFHELRGLGSDSLLYVKEDLLIPHHYTFYDLIVTKARGRSGPLFHFDVHDDVRMSMDASVEKDESHAGKIVTKSWFERNKMNFPASRWEEFNPKKGQEANRYTVKGGEVRGAFAPK